jgi:hypothetical protein
MGIPTANKVYGHKIIITNKKTSKEVFRVAYVWLGIVDNVRTKYSLVVIADRVK